LLNTAKLTKHFVINILTA